MLGHTERCQNHTIPIEWYAIFAAILRTILFQIARIRMFARLIDDGFDFFEFQFEFAWTVVGWTSFQLLNRCIDVLQINFSITKLCNIQQSAIQENVLFLCEEKRHKKLECCVLRVHAGAYSPMIEPRNYVDVANRRPY